MMGRFLIYDKFAPGMLGSKLLSESEIDNEYVSIIAVVKGANVNLEIVVGGTNKKPKEYDLPLFFHDGVVDFINDGRVVPLTELSRHNKYFSTCPHFDERGALASLDILMGTPGATIIKVAYRNQTFMRL